MQRLNRLYTRGIPNSIGFLRFLFAALVIFAHCFQISGLAPEPLHQLGDAELGHLALYMFFVLSGFLIARSYSTIDSLPRYLWHRSLRIFPAYWICLLFIAFVVAPLLYLHAPGPHSLHAFFALAPDSPTEYVTYNFLLAQDRSRIGHLLAGLPQPCCLDGSLWTLPYEFYCYLLVAAIGVFGLWSRRVATGRVVVLAICALYFVRYNFPRSVPWVGDLTKNLQGTDLVTFFLAGAIAYQWAERIPLHPILFVLALLVSVWLFRQQVLHCYGQISLAYVVFCLAAWLPLSWWDKPGDFSYGLYIYAWPIQQLLSAVGVPRWGITIYFLVCLLATLAAAVLSYKLIEKPALSLKHMRFSSSQARP